MSDGAERNISLMFAMLLSRKRRRLSYASWRKTTLSTATLLKLHLAHQEAGMHQREETKKERRWWVRPIFEDHDTHGAWATLIPKMRNEDREKFYNFFRMWPEDFDEILEKVGPFITKNSRRKPICPGERLAVTLRKLASGDSNMSLSYLFRISDDVISNILLETCHFIWRTLVGEVFESPSREMWLRVAAEYHTMWNFPHCLGAVDGVHVHVKAFPNAGTRFFNYKKRHSISVMAVADAKQRFLIVDSGSSGSRGDAGIFNSSEFSRMINDGSLDIPPPCPVDGLEGDLPFMFIGDCAYPRSANFQTPVKGKFLEPEENLFNYRLSRGRRSVENAFGILEKRFQILQGPIEGSLPFVKSAALACVALHNFHLRKEETIPPNRRKYRPPGMSDYIADDGSYVYGRWRQNNPKDQEKIFEKLISEVEKVSLTEDHEEEELDGIDVKYKLMEYFIENPVPWQWKTLKVL